MSNLSEYKTYRLVRLICLGALVVILGASYVAVGQTPSSSGKTGGDWKQVEDAMGRPGQLTGEVIRFAVPRKDLHVMVSGTAIKPGLALGSWAAFKRTETGAVVMGDLVLTDDEVSPVMRNLQEGGVEISALHNYLMGEQPRVMYMHISGHGDAVKMAQTIHAALALTKTPGPDASGAAQPSEAVGIDQKKIEEILGRTGKVNGGILQFGMPRAETITENAIQPATEKRLSPGTSSCSQKKLIS